MIDIAQQRNPSTRIAWNAARQAALAAGIADATYLPRLSAIVAGGAATTRSRTDIGPIDLGGDRVLGGIVAAASVEWLLFDFGGRAGLVESARQEAIIANFAFNEAHQRLLHAVTIAYHDSLAARARLALADGLVRNAQEVERAARHKFDRGIGTLLDIAQAESLVAEAEFFRVRAQGAVARGDALLLQAMGLPPESAIAIAEVDARALPQAPPALADSIIDDVLAARPDLQRAFAAERAAAGREAAARAQSLPKVFVSGTGSYVEGRLGISGIPGFGDQGPVLNVFGDRLGASIFAGLSIPLYDGGVRSNVRAQAQAERDATKARIEQVRNEAAREVIDSHYQLGTALSAHHQALALEKVAAIGRDAALLAFRNSEASMVEVMLAENALARARSAVSDARHAAFVAAANMALAAGAM
ncbi:TolC family protein [Erythrobacter sp. T5W1-R]|uniref:TolC family protein n=1 Tax=Erythrobacter sp. T5W1-R TaxID=3101752 RepID=UPI002B002C71|nr:TolC family protein [Erythrobacter sp. T5W1-R]MEA1619955.1 TolC family protein [Erythrobacter sp. T5W1-R]